MVRRRNHITIMETSNYDQQTINSRNPLARYAHRTRVKRSVQLATPRVGLGKIMDYGCGSGVFVSKMNSIREGAAVGYEPYMTERAVDGLPIYADFVEVERHGPYHTVTLFETIEHLTDSELDEFLERCGTVLVPGGVILISAPIEIGPALLLKEANRSVLRFKAPEYGFMEFLKAVILGIPGRRAPDIKTSHRGFDFRRSIRYLEMKGWSAEVLGYSPIPMGTWYGNSQVFLAMRKDGSRE
jgi:SAM-dependent methyltransferase